MTMQWETAIVERAEMVLWLYSMQSSSIAPRRGGPIDVGPREHAGARSCPMTRGRRRLVGGSVGLCLGDSAR
jgi:hypothetical protein